MPTTPYMKKMRPMRIATHGKAWKDLMKVQSRVRIPSPLLRSFTSLMTRNRRKKLMEIMFPPGWKYMKKILGYIFPQKKTGSGRQSRDLSKGPSLFDRIFLFHKVEKILKGSLDLITSPLPSVKIQIMGGKICLRCKGETSLGIGTKKFVNNTQQCFAFTPCM